MNPSPRQPRLNNKVTARRKPQPKERGQLCPREGDKVEETRGQGCPRSGKILAAHKDSDLMNDTAATSSLSPGFLVVNPSQFSGSLLDKRFQQWHPASRINMTTGVCRSLKFQADLHAMTPEQRYRYYCEVIYPRLLLLEGRICDATGVFDDVLTEVAYQELVRFYDEQVAAGFWHPLFTEAVGDFTFDDAASALIYYRRALDEARLLQEPTYTILIAMGERLFEIRQPEQAEACLCEGRAEAVRCGDDFYAKEADRILHETSA